MSEKDEVLRQISEIKSHLVDKETFFPYNYNACHVWSIISVVLTLVMVPAYEQSVVVGTVVSAVFIVVGFVVEGVLTKRVNETYDIDDCTKKQQFIMKNFIMLSLFAILLSMVLATFKLYVVILLVWLSLISFGQLAVGFVLNVKDFEKISLLNLVVAMSLLSVGIYFDLLVEQGMFLTLVQASVIFGLAVLPSWVAFRQKKMTKCNSEACCV